ncbi:hypothetical protein NDU88_011958 [Pleurodeles waltl]|uniref:Uncharacterized protein n=1 Tax=Pleurodeles waltl TaxID=8319 RepID=A0AAV7S2Q4_PLEWA|nr:hypothetical protein NDU88_011958 [Pleurodeles waltl]
MQQGILACERMGQNLEKRNEEEEATAVMRCLTPGFYKGINACLNSPYRLQFVSLATKVHCDWEDRQQCFVLGDAAGCQAARRIGAGGRRSSGKQRLPARPWEAATSFGRLLMVIEFVM